jgi:hypothetical protein
VIACQQSSLYLQSICSQSRMYPYLQWRAITDEISEDPAVRDVDNNDIDDGLVTRRGQSHEETIDNFWQFVLALKGNRKNFKLTKLLFHLIDSGPPLPSIVTTNHENLFKLVEKDLMQVEYNFHYPQELSADDQIMSSSTQFFYSTFCTSGNKFYQYHHKGKCRFDK